MFVLRLMPASWSYNKIIWTFKMILLYYHIRIINLSHRPDWQQNTLRHSPISQVALILRWDDIAIISRFVRQECSQIWWANIMTIKSLSSRFEYTILLSYQPALFDSLRGLTGPAINRPPSRGAVLSEEIVSGGSYCPMLRLNAISLPRPLGLVLVTSSRKLRWRRAVM